jgi:hypothetical protein
MKHMLITPPYPWKRGAKVEALDYGSVGFRHGEEDPAWQAQIDLWQQSLIGFDVVRSIDR